MSEKPFPIQRSWPKRGEKYQPHPLSIPWSVAELAYSVYQSKCGSSQSLERLAERGGFGACEMDDLLPDWRHRVDVISQQATRIAALETALREATSIIDTLPKMQDGKPAYPGRRVRSVAMTESGYQMVEWTVGPIHAVEVIGKDADGKDFTAIEYVESLSAVDAALASEAKPTPSPQPESQPR